MPETDASPTRNRRGRPARLSRLQVLEAGIELLGEGGGHGLSIRQLAQRLGTVPGNLYTYFPSKDALLDALAEHALGALRIEPDPALAWDEQLEQWMEQFHQLLLTRPELMVLIGLAGTAPSTLRKIEYVAGLMQGAGLDTASAVQHAQGLLWTVMSFTLFETQATDPGVVRQLRQAGEHAQDSDVMRNLALEDLQPLWRSTLQRNLDGIRWRVAQVGDARAGEFSLA